MRFRPIVCNLCWIMFHITIWQCLCNQMSDFQISNLNKCWQGDSYFTRIFGISLQRCVEECGKRLKCNGINYRRKTKQCELLPTTTTTASLLVNNIADGPCTSVHRNDMHTQTSCNCTTHEVCNSTGNCSVQECLPFLITNGNYLGNLNNIDALVTFTCDSGFTEVNNKSAATCLVNGTWSVSPQCNIECLEPPEIANSFISPGGNISGETRQYGCVNNYGTTNDVNDMKTTCLEDGSWSTTSFICIRDCGGLPPPPTNGNVAGSTYLQGDEVTYSCNEGHVVVGETTTTCQANGSWDNVGSLCVCSILPQASTTPNMLFSHAGYGDSDYDNNIDCYWVIEAREGYTIDFSIKEMEIENRNNNAIGNDNCYDYVEVFDGRNGRTTKLGKYCGRTVPAAISSTGKYLLVHFHSDVSVQKEGFSVEYKEGGQITN